MLGNGMAHFHFLDWVLYVRVCMHNGVGDHFGHVFFFFFDWVFVDLDGEWGWSNHVGYFTFQIEFRILGFGCRMVDGVLLLRPSSL